MALEAGIFGRIQTPITPGFGGLKRLRDKFAPSRTEVIPSVDLPIQGELSQELALQQESTPLENITSFVMHEFTARGGGADLLTESRSKKGRKTYSLSEDGKNMAEALLSHMDIPLDSDESLATANDYLKKAYEQLKTQSDVQIHTNALHHVFSSARMQARHYVRAAKKAQLRIGDSRPLVVEKETIVSPVVYPATEKKRGISPLWAAPFVAAALGVAAYFGVGQDTANTPATGASALHFDPSKASYIASTQAQQNFETQAGDIALTETQDFIAGAQMQVKVVLPDGSVHTDAGFFEAQGTVDDLVAQLNPHGDKIGPSDYGNVVRVNYGEGRMVDMVDSVGEGKDGKYDESWIAPVWQWIEQGGDPTGTMVKYTLPSGEVVYKRLTGIHAGLKKEDVAVGAMWKKEWVKKRPYVICQKFEGDDPVNGHTIEWTALPSELVEASEGEQMVQSLIQGKKTVQSERGVKQTSHVIFEAKKPALEAHADHGFNMARNNQNNPDVIARNRAQAMRRAAFRGRNG